MRLFNVFKQYKVEKILFYLQKVCLYIKRKIEIKVFFFKMKKKSILIKKYLDILNKIDVFNIELYIFFYCLSYYIYIEFQDIRMLYFYFKWNFCDIKYILW